MKLFWSAASPYARKCRIFLRERGFTSIEEITVDAFSDPATLIAANPLGKVPSLALDDGSAVFDSRVICTYLDGLGSGAKLIPDSPVERLNVLRAEALADGVMDLSVSISMERRKPEGEKSPTFVARWRGQLDRALDAMQAELPRLGVDVGLAHAAFGSALGYLDFRQPGIDWRTGRAALADWFAAISTRPSFAETAPK